MSIIQALTEATAIRLYNSVRTTDEPSDRTVFLRQHPQTIHQNSIDSIRSSNEFNNSCRICRWNRSDMELAKCPCLCKGSVGFIHWHCLNRWIMHRRDTHCEICNATFDIPEKFSIRRMLRTFVCHCAAPILKHLLFSVSLMPLAYIILQQVVICMENVNLSPSEDLTFKQVALATSALMTSSALFLNFFEFISTRIIMVGNILRHWWLFGSSSDFTLIQMDSDIFEIFT